MQQDETQVADWQGAKQYRAAVLAARRLFPPIQNEEPFTMLATAKITSDVSPIPFANRNPSFTHLKRSCDFLDTELDTSAASQQLNSLIESYVHAVPGSARHTDRSDFDRFLRWVASPRVQNNPDLCFEEITGLLANVQSRNTLEFITCKRRLSHHRFQQRVINTQQRLEKTALSSRSKLTLNPLTMWATFETSVLIDQETKVPATVLFYATLNGVQTTVLGKEAISILKQLERGDATLKSLLKSQRTRDDARLQKLIQELVNLGVIACR